MSESYCSTCYNYNGNCGFHHIDSNGHINYEIPGEWMLDKGGIASCYKPSLKQQKKEKEEIVQSIVENYSKDDIIFALKKLEERNEQKMLQAQEG